MASFFPKKLLELDQFLKVSIVMLAVSIPGGGLATFFSCVEILNNVG